jgi:taurine--2-oxoglutarate transaminase
LLDISSLLQAGGRTVALSSLDDLKTLHKRRVLTPWSAQAAVDAPVIVRAEGVSMYDDAGKRYIDASSGLVAVNLGHSHPTVGAAIKAQTELVQYSPAGWFNDKRAMLADRLIDLAPWGDEGGRVFFTTGGTESTEDAIRTARAITKRGKVLSAYRSFHGSSMGSAAVTGENRRWPSEPIVAPGVVHFFTPYPYRSTFNTRDPQVEVERALAHLRDVLMYEDPDRVAAIIIEPVVGSNGFIVYPEGYLAGLRAICDEYGIILIFDEVMTGFGRTGAAFAATRFGVVPDMMTFAKGVTSAYVPLGGFMIRENLAKYFDENILWIGHTYSGHPMATAAGLGALDAYRDEHIFERCAKMEPIFRAGLEALKAKHPIVGDVRGVGLMFAVEFVKDRETREPLVPWQGKTMGPMPTLFKGLRERGVYAYGRYANLNLAPPLIVTEAEIGEILTALDGAIGDLAAAAAKT